MDTGYVNVAIRLRPSQNLLENSIGIEVINQNPPVLIVKKDKQQSYVLDKIFSKDAPQQEVYNEVVKPLVNHVLNGFNCTVFAYGQTGTGKTFTIGSDPSAYEDAGFIMRSLDEFFGAQEEYVEHDISISFYEIYNEKVFDLLSSSKTELLVKNFQVQGLSETKVLNSSEALRLLKFGSKNRHIGETKLNRKSSRSHAIFTIYCNVTKENQEGTRAKFNLVDLAGSESVRKTGSKGSQFKEGVNINKGLLILGRVIYALSVNAHVPCRSAVLTAVLQDSLNKNNYIALVVCISPDSEDVQETIHTLDFAQSVKKLKNKPEINHIIDQYKKHNPQPGSAMKAAQTPWKLPNYSLPNTYTGSTAKKAKINHTWTPMNNTHEPKDIANLNSPGSLFSISVTSISGVDAGPSSTLTPIAQKCIALLEPKIKKQLATWSAKKCTPVRDVLSTSQVSMQILMTEIRQIVRSELINFNTEAAAACSSPIHNFDESYNSERINNNEIHPAPAIVAKRLNFEEDAMVDQPFFKMPVAPPKKPAKQKKGRDKDSTLDNSSTFMDISLPSTRTDGCRRSVRLSLKRGLSPILSASPANRRQSNRSRVNTESPPDAPLRRPAGRPKAIPAQKLKKSSKNLMNHNQYILNILNNGDQKELQKLPLIGEKTAMQIFFHRKVNGQFNCIADFGKMGSWRGTGFQRFLSANCLTIEDDN